MAHKPEHDERWQQHTPTPAAINPAAGRSRGNRFVHLAFLGAASILTVCVIIQVFFAGMAVFVSPTHWAQHTSFIHIFEYVPLIMLLLSFAGRLPARLRWLSAALFVSIVVQYATANVGGSAPFAAAAHPVVAMVIFWLSVKTTLAAWQSTTTPHEQAQR